MRLFITGILTLIIFIMISAFKNNTHFSETNYPETIPNFTETTAILFDTLPREILPLFHLHEPANIPFINE